MESESYLFHTYNRQRDLNSKKNKQKTTNVLSNKTPLKIILFEI